MNINGINYTFGHQRFTCMVKLMKQTKDGYFMISEDDKKVYCERCDAYVKKSAKCHNKLWIMNTGILRQKEKKERAELIAENNRRFELIKEEALFKLDTVNQLDLDELLAPEKPEEPESLEELREQVADQRRIKQMKKRMNKRIMMRQIVLVNSKYIKYMKKNTFTLDEAIEYKEQINKFNITKIIVKPEYYIQRKEDIDRLMRKLSEAHYEVVSWSFKEVTKTVVIDRQEYEITTLELSKEKTVNVGLEMRGIP